MKKQIFLLIPTLLLSSCGGDPQLEYKSFEIRTFQPYFNKVEGGNDNRWPLPEDFTNYNQLVPGAASYLKDNISTITYNTKSQNEILTSDMFKGFGPNQILLFEGHGSFSPWYKDDVECHSVMWTGKDVKQVDEDDEDHKELRLVIADTWNDALTSEFVDYYCGDLTGSLIYLGNCLSGRDVSFAQAFLNKGASAVIGNSHTTQAFYNSCIEYTTIKYLGIINPNTKKTYTLYEALCKAKEIYGKNDKAHEPYACGSEPFIFGDPNFCLSDFKK